MKRLLLISPHFPPDGSAGTHRARVLAPHLEAAGWRPTVLTVDPRDYEGTLDNELSEMLPAGLSVERARVLGPRWTRAFGLGDLGFRALLPLRRRANAILRAQPHDAVYVTTYPIYTALLGPWIRARFAIPFVLDLQDPWTGAWGLTVGGGRDGRPDAKSRASRAIAARLEAYVLPKADALTGVSSGLIEEMARRYPQVSSRPRLTLPIGVDLRDVEWVRGHPAASRGFDSRDGRFHLCSVGTLQPLGIPPLRVFLAALARFKAESPAAAERVRVHFIGTSNQSVADAPRRVEPHARELGVADLVDEQAQRVPYADALRVLMAASAVLVMGSTEARYTASKIGPALMCGKPLLVMVHRDSDMFRQLEPKMSPSLRLIGLEGDPAPAEVTNSVHAVLTEWAARVPPKRPPGPETEQISGPALAARLAGLLNPLVVGRA